MQPHGEREQPCIGDRLARQRPGGIIQPCARASEPGEEGRRCGDEGRRVVIGAADIGKAEAVRDGKARDLELRFHPERGDFRSEPVAHVDDAGRVVAVGLGVGCGERREIGAVTDVVAGQETDFGVGVGAAHRDRQRTVIGLPVVEILAVEPDMAPGKFAGQVGLDLAAGKSVEPDFARPFARTVEPARMEPPAAAQRAAIGKIDAFEIVADPARHLQHAAGTFAGVRDEVDQSPG